MAEACAVHGKTPAAALVRRGLCAVTIALAVFGWLTAVAGARIAAGGALGNGTTHTGAISVAGQTDSWTFTANAGDRIAVHVGEITDDNDFRPWIRLSAPDGTSLGDTSGTGAAAIEAVAPTSGTYLVRVASFDSGLDGTGTYRLTMAHTPGPISISPGDEGGPLVNGGLQSGEIVTGDLDVWTLTANAGDRIAVHVGQVVDNDDFRPWIRLWAPNGATLGNSSGTDAASIEAVAPTSGTYLVLVASFDSGLDGTGTYRLSEAQTPGPITISPGDQGGPLANGALQTGEILKGDLDVWTFTARAGQRIGVHVGEITDNDDFRPWIRLWSPKGATLGDTSGTGAAAIEAVAPVKGTYLVLVASFDSGLDGSGTYRLTLGETHGKVIVSSGDQGGALKNGALHSGEILRGDLDVWKFKALAGQRIAVHVGQVVDNDDFRPWIRLWAPNGATLGNSSGTDAAAIEAVAPTSGTYFVLVATFDSGLDGTGTYRLTMTHTPGPIVVSKGDQGGPLANGALHSGEIVKGDLDVWTFTANAGDRIAVHVGEIVDNDDFQPWIRLWAPNGATLGDTSGTNAAAIESAAPITGTYLVLVASFDSGLDGTGTYRLTMTHTPGPITVSPGDQGGPLSGGVPQSGEILQGDLDVWTVTLAAGQHVSVTVTQTSELDDFRPWLRLWSPTGATLGDASGTDSATVSATAPTSGTYLILVASFDSGLNGTGTYTVEADVSP
jgi:uncharacterized protein YfaP (DUF2135 family)